MASQRRDRRVALSRRAWLLAAVAACGGGQVARAQSTPVADAPLLRVELPGGATKAFSVADLERLPVETVDARLRDGPPFKVSGVSATTLLKLAGLDLSANLGGATVVGQALVARAADGYVAVFGLAEVDPHFGHPPLIVAWRNADGSPLRAGVGPVQLISSGESRPSRWVRRLEALTVRDLR